MGGDTLCHWPAAAGLLIQTQPQSLKSCIKRLICSSTIKEALTQLLTQWSTARGERIAWQSLAGGTECSQASSYPCLIAHYKYCLSQPMGLTAIHTNNNHCIFFLSFIHLILNNLVSPLVWLLHGVITEGHSKSLEQKEEITQLVGPPIDISWPNFLEVNEAGNSWGFSSFFLIVSALITTASFLKDHHSWKLRKKITITS